MLVTACGGAQPPPEPVAAATPADSAAPEAAAAPPPATAATAPKTEEKKADAPKQDAAPAPVLRYAEGIATPESVLYDDTADRYLVSNINGKPLDVDNNGYIAELSPDGKVSKPKFIAGGANDVKLNAPKGLTLSGGILYVSDITTVRKFDAKTGAAKGEVPVPGATFLNDLAAAPDGRVFVSDSGLKAGKDALDPTGTDAVYVIEKGKLKPVAKSKELGQPNGLLASDKGVMAVTYGSNELYRLDEKGARQDITKLPEGGLDGIAMAGDKLLVASWKGSAIYRGKLGEKFDVVIPNVKGPADIGFDSKRNRVLVPRFVDNAIEIYDLK
ncbi:MAG TPA: hypothetical protein VGP93_12705 [Polyangiaceae bacterium]|nr:hypothetical protein [Polyangiaceae bacterium]